MIIVDNAINELKTRDIPDDVASVCRAIIEHISRSPKSFSHLSFMDLYRISPQVNEESFYEAVFLLTRHPYNILTQNFEALHPRGGYQIVPDREDIIDAMKSNDFFNPFTGEELNEDEFGKQVLMFFSPSEELLMAVKNA